MDIKYTDEQLRRTLAKLLSNVVSYTEHNPYLRWWESLEAVRDTELLHLCWLVEGTLNFEEGDLYVTYLESETKAGTIPICYDKSYWFTVVNATWQQRTIALAKVKGVEIV